MEPQFTSRTIDVRGKQLHFLEGGQGEPLLLLHPSGGAGIWHPHHSLLAQSYRVIAPDHPGFGKSPPNPEIDTVDDIAVLYLDLLDTLGIEKAFVVGSSFGGWVAAELAVLASHRIAGLALIAALGQRIPGHPITDLFALNPERKVAVLFRDPAAAAGSFPEEPTVDDIMMMYRDETAFAHFAWEPFCCNPKLAGRLHRITTPTLVLWGNEDKVVPLEHGRQYSERIPNSRLEILRETGHAVLFERPEAAVGLVQKFFQA